MLCQSHFSSSAPNGLLPARPHEPLQAGTQPPSASENCSGTTPGGGRIIFAVSLVRMRLASAWPPSNSDLALQCVCYDRNASRISTSFSGRDATSLACCCLQLV